MSSPETIRGPVAVVLAAGQGKRMRSERPKVLHEVGGRPMISWVVDAARAAGCRRIVVVIGHRGDEVQAALRDRNEGEEAEHDLVWVEQPEQRGTGDALLQAARAVKGEALLLVLSGDVPLVRAETLERLVAAASGGWGALAVAELAEPASLGRVFASPDGSLDRIVESADATDEELAERTVNAGLYALPAPAIFRYLEGVGTDNAQGELYLTDAVVAAAREGRAVALLELASWEEAQGINTRGEQAAIHRAILARKATELEAAGVTLWDAARTVVEPGVAVGPDTVIHPGAVLTGRTVVGAGCVIREGAWLRDTRLADGVTIEPYSVLDGAAVGAGSRIGPFARIRPESEIGAGSKLGNFVEVKSSRLGAGVKAGHLAYLGDASVAEGANIGAGTITCNYDGVDKHRTEIGARAFIGSDTMLVAPVKIGDDATTGAGSVITGDVPDGALAVERSRQRTLPGWSRRRGRKRKD
jgi:bifunctional UDP-N-acetylglucosamine pyrophosphorylase/glucosamine-1-phosphate N-acetyltransferase